MRKTIFQGFLMLGSVCLFCACDKVTRTGTGPLCVSGANPHLLETARGNPFFLNSCTVWLLTEEGKREDIAEFLGICKELNYNAVSAMILGIETWKDSSYHAGISPYGALAFQHDASGLYDPLQPITTPGNDPEIPGEYDFWDHLDYAVDLIGEMGMYIFLHPAWGNWFQGSVHGQVPGDRIIIDEPRAYHYGRWLGQRYGGRDQIIWMAGGDRSAINDSKTRWYTPDTIQDFRALYRALAEGLADGSNGIDIFDGQADYSRITISYHPRKWGPNSSEWFHQDPWLDFNSIQDTPVDQMVALPTDYNLVPAKPTFLYEPVYEGAIHSWGVRYQAYQTVLMGGFGHNYGSDLWKFRSDWRDYTKLPGFRHMAHLWTVAREIWTDAQYLSRMPDEELIFGEPGETRGRGIFSVSDFETKTKQEQEYSDRLTAMRGRAGDWAMVYSAGGRDVPLNLAKLQAGRMDAYWFNPRNGKWWSDGSESDVRIPFSRGVQAGEGFMVFETPGKPGPDNDWMLVLMPGR